MRKHESSGIETVGNGTRLYEYDSKARLGFGAFAIVFKGWTKDKNSTEVAIKVIAKKKLTKTQNLLDKEIKILRELTKHQHENVVALFECIDQPNDVYLVMEFCNGGDFQDYLSNQKKLSENTIKLFTKQLAGAMRALNEKGVVHRDLKPQNILLKFDSKYPFKHNDEHHVYPKPEEITLKIADFGFARFLPEGGMAATMCGSPMYMAPEVIMSHRYDAKADLWSLGTIIYQCFVGVAPFLATTPAGLKQIYERSYDLKPTFPDNISADLKDLLIRMLKKNSADRITFEEFFNHRFLNPPITLKPIQSHQNEILNKNIRINPHKTRTMSNCEESPSPVCEIEVPQSTKFNFPTVPSPIMSDDDFVLVPANLPTDKTLSKDYSESSPPRPSTLQIQISKPNKFVKKDSLMNIERKSLTSIIDRRERRDSYTADINSISPPSVQFVLGTPPLCRRPPDSPTNFSNKNWGVTPTGSPLRRSVVSSPLLTSPFTAFNSTSFIPKTGFNTRAITLPEIKNVGSAMEMVFPELQEGILFQKEHTETLTKLNFARALVECIQECASPSRDRSERLILLVYALQRLSCGLFLASGELKCGKLQPTAKVQEVLKKLNEKFHKCLEDCKKLNTSSVLQKESAPAEKILYNYALEMCQKAALSELQNNLTECWKRYQTAYILLHSLHQQNSNQQDKGLLLKYRMAVEKRLYLLQQEQQEILNQTGFDVENNV